MDDGEIVFTQPPGKLPGKGAQVTAGSALLKGPEYVQLKSPTRLTKGNTFSSADASNPFIPVPF
ncbi:MAG TPA: hypothetical protein VMF10_14445 [Candidatus Aquilonibacter sp.]|nr:hypothetical protein [Candidatus Aquilonibacter sp.]